MDVWKHFQLYYNKKFMQTIQYESIQIMKISKFNLKFFKSDTLQTKNLNWVLMDVRPSQATPNPVDN